MGRMNVMGPTGDEELTWDPDDEASVAKAKKEWDRLKKEGYEFYEVKESRGERLKRFNKRQARVIAAPGVRSATDEAKGERKKASRGGPNAEMVGRCPLIVPGW